MDRDDRLESRHPTPHDAEPLAAAPSHGNGQLSLFRLAPQDMPAMLDLFARATQPDQLARSIYVSHGAEAYLRALALHPDLQKHDQLWGLKDGAGALVAAAHTRNLETSSHLNQVAVEPACQGRGLGAWLLAHWESLARSQSATVQTLDVAEANVGARRFYARHGFLVSSITHEFRYQDALPPGDGCDPVLLQWPMALATSSQFGFGRFQVLLDGHPLSVDLTGTTFRTSSKDARMLALLGRLDPARDILLRSAEREHGEAWQFTGTLHRMRRELWTA